jgi:hypothetical protein
MKTLLLTLAISLTLVRLVPAQTNAVNLADGQPMPTLDNLIQHVVARAVNQEDKNDNLFDMNYQYTRTRTWEYRNANGDLKSRDEKSSVENKPQRIAAKAARLSTPNKPAGSTTTPKGQTVTDANSTIKGKALKVKDYSIPNLIQRFQFNLVGRDTVNGRPSYVVDFKPKSDDLPINQFADKFINKAAGRVWIDAEDYAIAQAQLHLLEPVSVLGGLVGVVRKFTYDFTRVRTPEGYWFARDMDWHLEGREVVVNRIVDYHEHKLNAQKIVMTASAD